MGAISSVPPHRWHSLCTWKCCHCIAGDTLVFRQNSMKAITSGNMRCDINMSLVASSCCSWTLVTYLISLPPLPKPCFGNHIMNYINNWLTSTRAGLFYKSSIWKGFRTSSNSCHAPFTWNACQLRQEIYFATVWCTV